jgi:hypothetical protein
MRLLRVATAIASAALLCQTVVAQPVDAGKKTSPAKKEEPKEEKKDPKLNKYFHEPGYGMPFVHPCRAGLTDNVLVAMTPSATTMCVLSPMSSRTRSGLIRSYI